MDAKTVARYVAVRDAGGTAGAVVRRRLIDPFLAKVEEWVDRSKGKIRADKVHGGWSRWASAGSERTTRRAVAEVKAAWRAGHRRTYRPWIPEPGMWLQWDWGDGPQIGGRKTQLFCCVAGLVPVPGGDPDLGPDAGHADLVPGPRCAPWVGAPTYLLTDNEKTVTIEHVAGIPVRHPEMVALGPALRLQGADVCAVRSRSPRAASRRP